MKILGEKQTLFQHRIIDEEGKINKPLVFIIIDALMQDEVAKSKVLGYPLKYYKLKYYKQEVIERLLKTLPKNRVEIGYRV